MKEMLQCFFLSSTTTHYFILKKSSVGYLNFGDDVIMYSEDTSMYNFLFT